MSTNRTRKRRPPRGLRLSPEAIAAWSACDYHALHCALGLAPWEASPLPLEVTALGVSEAADPPRANNTLHDESHDRALKLQRLLLAAVGWPDCKQIYKENLREAEEMRDYYAELIAHPEYGGQGTGSDPASRQRALQDADAAVAYRRQLLDELDEK